MNDKGVSSPVRPPLSRHRHTNTHALFLHECIAVSLSLSAAARNYTTVFVSVSLLEIRRKALQLFCWNMLKKDSGDRG